MSQYFAEGERQELEAMSSKKEKLNDEIVELGTSSTAPQAAKRGSLPPPKLCGVPRPHF
jgi:hypothetical protein